MQKTFKFLFCIVIFNSLISCESIQRNQMAVVFEKSNTQYKIADTKNAKLIIKRSNDMLYTSLSPKIYINGVDVASLDKNGEYLSEVSPGPITIKVDHWSSPGGFSQAFETKKGCKYFIIVSPRRESILPGLLGGMIGLMVDSAINENSGLFQIVIDDVECDEKAGSK